MADHQSIRPASYVLLTNDGALLLCRLSAPAGDKLWTLPGGGLDFGEHPEAGGIREALEETGFEVELIGDPKIDTELYEGDVPSVHHIRFIYQGRIVGGQMRHEVDGSTDLCQWVTPEEAASMPLVGLAELGMRLVFPSYSPA